MLKQTEEIITMIQGLKDAGFPVSVVEKELGFYNGLIGKVVKGGFDLSDERFEKLQKFHVEKVGIMPPIETKQLVVNGNGNLKEVPSKAAINRVSKTMEELNKRFGAGTIMKFGDKPDTSYKVISTGSFGLDRAVGIGGFPRGRIVEIFGWESSGKTTIALNVIANAQKENLRCLYIDAENAFDPEYAEALGVKIDEIDFSQPQSGEEGLDIAEKMISDGQVDVVVFDSVAALVPRGELDGSHGDSKMGLHARLMSQACRKLTGIIAKNNVLVIFINQLRHKIGVTYGDPAVTTGGNALKFYASMRIAVSRSTTEANSVTNDGVKDGNLTTVKVAKNKCAPPFRSCSFDIIYGKGIDKAGEIMTVGVDEGIITKAGNTYTYDTTKLGVGIEAAKRFLEDNENILNEIETRLKSEK